MQHESDGTHTEYPAAVEASTMREAGPQVRSARPRAAPRGAQPSERSERPAPEGYEKSGRGTGGQGDRGTGGGGR